MYLHTEETPKSLIVCEALATLTEMGFWRICCSWTLIPKMGPGLAEFPRCQRRTGITKRKDCSLKFSLQDSFLKGSCQVLAQQPALVLLAQRQFLLIFIVTLRSKLCSANTLRWPWLQEGEAGQKRVTKAFLIAGDSRPGEITWPAQVHRENLWQRQEPQLDLCLLI